MGLAIVLCTLATSVSATCTGTDASCSAYDSAATCVGANLGCSWGGDPATGGVPTTGTGTGTCEGAHVACSTYYSETVCEAHGQYGGSIIDDQGCSWNSGSHTTYAGNCTGTDASCSAYHSPVACVGADRGCSWSGTGPGGMEHCGGNGRRTSDDQICMMETSPGRCGTTGITAGKCWWSRDCWRCEVYNRGPIYAPGEGPGNTGGSSTTPSSSYGGYNPYSNYGDSPSSGGASSCSYQSVIDECKATRGRWGWTCEEITACNGASFCGTGTHWDSSTNLCVISSSSNYRI